jgi:hypothetical protein
MLFALAVSLFSCLLFGLLPALKYAGSPFVPALRIGGPSAGTSRARHRARSLLVVGQVSLALVLLVTSGLMIRTFQEIRKVQPGFTKAEQVQTFRLSIPMSQVEQPERVVRMWNDILERLAAIPGVSAAALTNSFRWKARRIRIPSLRRTRPANQGRSRRSERLSLCRPDY